MRCAAARPSAAPAPRCSRSRTRAAAAEQPLDDLIALSEALERLERLDARQAQVVECRFFGGLSLDETAEALNTSAATVSRDWTFARAWLHHELATAARAGRHSSIRRVPWTRNAGSSCRTGSRRRGQRRPPSAQASSTSRRQIDPDLAAQVRALLAADASTGVMDALAPQLASVAQVLERSGTVRVGAYRIVSEIGRGGMGAVYLADRADADFEHRVAIKLIGTSDAADPLHQRFLAERRILAGLVHPHIARLLDGGVTDDGRPYLVMEYVDGLPITSYCAERQLDVPARLRLFADVCAAVQHAHQNLVIHRDLKPSNILVSADGRVHLLDFGIAKLIDPAAAPGDRHAHRIADDDAGLRQPGTGQRRDAGHDQRHLFARRPALRAVVRLGALRIRRPRRR